MTEIDPYQPHVIQHTCRVPEKFLTTPYHKERVIRELALRLAELLIPVMELEDEPLPPLNSHEEEIKFHQLTARVLIKRPQKRTTVL